MPGSRPVFAALLLLAVAACARPEPPPTAPPLPAVSPETAAMYGAEPDGDLVIPAVPQKYLSDDKARQIVDYWTDEEPGTIIVDPYARRLYLVMEDEKAMRYTVAVGEEGYGFAGEAHVPYQRDWPGWRPTDNMIARAPEEYGPVAEGLDGGLDNPLGARALYLHNGQGDTYYRIHGTNDVASIGKSTSAGCIRLFNQDIVDLAAQVDSMAKVIVLTEAESGKGTVPPGQPLPQPPADPAQTGPVAGLAANPAAGAITPNAGDDT
jgi:lipoprotein-anchoring transpeptidase ErfK/SrfK